VFAAFALVDAGEAMKQLAEVKYALEDGVKQNFLEPLLMRFVFLCSTFHIRI